MENVISIEVAEKEWRNFLEENDAEGLIPASEKPSPKDKEIFAEYQERKQAFDKVAKAIAKGNVTINGTIATQNLKYPILGKDNGNMVLDKLVFDKRWTAKDREEIFKGIDTKEQSDLLLANRRLCSKLTGVDMVILQRLDSSDLKITDNIVSVFFM